jgi:hypothetical protein
MSTITLLSHRQYSVLSTARILTFFEPKDANTGPLSQANALANPHISGSEHPKCPYGKNSFMTETPDAARQSHHDDNASTDGPPGLKSVMNRLD